MALLERTAKQVAAAEPRARVEVTCASSTATCAAYLDAVPEVIDAAEAAIRAEGIEPIRTPIRGGTDGSRLSEMGLPTPNIFTGGHEYHSVREWASVQDMAAAAAVVVRLAEVWAQERRWLAPPGIPRARSTATIMLASEATIPATDEGLIRGDGVFEVIRRLRRPAVRVRARIWPGSSVGGEPAASASISRRSAPTPGGCSRRPAPAPSTSAADHGHPRRPAAAVDRAAAGRPEIVRLAIGHLLADAHPRRRSSRCRTAANMLAGRLAREQGFDEALLVTPHGRVLEAPTSSIFWVKDGELLTPPLDEHILASITRAIVIEATGAAERSCTLEELLAADEAFLASTTREVQPISAIDERDVRRAGPVTARTREAVEALVREQLEAETTASRPPQNSMKVLTVIGNRPQFIKAAAVSPRLRERHQELLIHTGQHFDDELSAVFFAELGLPAPDRELGIALGSNTLPDRADADRARAGGRRGGARCGARLRRHELDARRRARRRRRPASRSRTSRPGCARSTARCPRSSTACSTDHAALAAAVLLRGRGRRTCGGRA